MTHIDISDPEIREFLGTPLFVFEYWFEDQRKEDNADRR